MADQEYTNIAVKYFPATAPDTYVYAPQLVVFNSQSYAISWGFSLSGDSRIKIATATFTSSTDSTSSARTIAKGVVDAISHNEKESMAYQITDESGTVVYSSAKHEDSDQDICPSCYSDIVDKDGNGNQTWDNDPIRTPEALNGRRFRGSQFLRRSDIIDIQETRNLQEVAAGLDQTGFSNIYSYSWKDCTISGTTVAVTNHGFINGDRIRFQGDSLPEGLDSNQNYFVINKQSSSFQVSKGFNNKYITFSGSGENVQVKKLTCVNAYKSHITELRTATEDILDASNQSMSDYFNKNEDGVSQGSSQSNWTNATLSDYANVRALHIEDLRHHIEVSPTAWVDALSGLLPEDFSESVSEEFEGVYLNDYLVNYSHSTDKVNPLSTQVRIYATTGSFSSNIQYQDKTPALIYSDADEKMIYADLSLSADTSRSMNAALYLTWETDTFQTPLPALTINNNDTFFIEYTSTITYEDSDLVPTYYSRFGFTLYDSEENTYTLQYSLWGPDSVDVRGYGEQKYRNTYPDWYDIYTYGYTPDIYLKQPHYYADGRTLQLTGQEILEDLEHYYYNLDTSVTPIYFTKRLHIHLGYIYSWGSSREASSQTYFYKVGFGNVSSENI